MFFSKRIKNNKKALTLVEILVVILIIAILIAALIPRITAALDKAKETQVRTDFRIFSVAAESVMRDYSGFAGVPLVDSKGMVVSTLGNQFWNKGNDVSEAVTTAVTQSLIKAMNRYLESNFQFGIDVTQTNFGRCMALDPWKKPYEIYFVARSKNSQIDDTINSDKIYIVSNGKTQNVNYPDYTMLCEYKKDEVRTANAGFIGETYPANSTYFAGALNKSQYVVIGSLFNSMSTNSGFTTPTATPVIGANSLFVMKASVINTGRLFIEKNPAPLSTALTAVNAS